MPYRITWKDKLIVFEYYGKVTSADIRESNQQAYGDSRFDSLKWELVLFDEAETVEFKESDIRLIAYMDKAAAQSNPYITVVFAGKSEAMEQIQELYSKMDSAAPWPVVSFDSYESAIAHISEN